MVMQTTDVGDCDDRATGSRLDSSVGGSILKKNDVALLTAVVYKSP
jgi:hypothetical protein